MFKLSVLSLKNRALIALVTIVAAVFGGLAMTGLKQELIPSVTIPQLVVVSSYPGASPAVVNTDVSTPIETAVQGITGLSSTSATSSNGQSVVNVGFDYGTDLVFAEQRVTQALNRIDSTLPESVDSQVISGSIDDFPVLQIAVSGGDQDENAQTITDIVAPDLEDIDGVREAALTGERGNQVTVTVDDDRLADNGVSAADVRTAIESNGVLLPAGTVTEEDRTLSVQAGSSLASVDDISALPVVPSAPAAGQGQFPTDSVGAEPGVPSEGDVPSDVPAADPDQVVVGDVADVVAEESPVTSISRVNGEPALSIGVTKLPDANTVEVSTAVHAMLDDIREVLADDASVTVVFDQAPFIQESIDTLAVEGLLGLVFAVLVILVFLLDIRATIVTAISIPTSLLITLIGLQFADYSLNILTLGALTIAIGRVVDDSIVVIENIKVHLAAIPPGQNGRRSAAIVAGVREVSGAITASTITTVAVFLPLAFVGDMTGELFRPFALTASLAMLASLLVSLTIVPVLAYWFLRPSSRREQKRASAEATSKASDTTPAPTRPDQTDTAGGELSPGRITTATAVTPARAAHQPSALDVTEKPDLLHRLYRPIIRWTLAHSGITVAASIVLLIGTVALAPLMKVNFLGDTGQNTLTVSQTLDENASLESQDESVQLIEDALTTIPEIETVQVAFGSGTDAAALAFGGGSAINYFITTDGEADQVALQTEVRDELATLDGAGEIEVTASDAGGFGGNVIAVAVAGPNESDLTAGTETLVDAFTGLDGIAEVTSNLSASASYVEIEVDRDAAAGAGYSEVALGTLVSERMQSTEIGSLELDDERLRVLVQNAETPDTIEQVRAIEVPTPTGVVPLSDLAEVSEVEGPSSITTERGIRTATVSITPSGDDLGAATAQVFETLDSTELPGGVTTTIGGVSADQAEAFEQLGIALLAAILIVYVVMVAAFRSLLQPILLLVSVPFAATGTILLQLVTGVPFGVSSLIGALMLIGIVVTNAIVLVDLVNQYRRRGENVRDSVEHGSLRRLRPILMTALATIFALTPMALGITGHGGFISQPLAIVVIGGLVSSTVLTLVVLPTLYNLVEGARERRAEKRAAKAANAS